MNNEFYNEDTIRRHLLEQGIWDKEVDEVIENFNNPSIDDLNIIVVYDSAFELGRSYIDYNVGSIDHHIEAVLNYTELGKEIADTDDEYLALSSGRIIKFDI